MPHPLALSPSLRAWTRLGLDALLLDSPRRVEELRLRADSAAQSSSAPGSRPSVRPPERHTSPHSVPSGKAACATSLPRAAQPDRPAQPASRRSA